MVIECLTIIGFTGIHARQMAIVDYTNVKFATTGIAISAVTQSSVNCGGTVWIARSGKAVAAISGSEARLDCNFVQSDNLTFDDAWLIATDKSKVFMQDIVINEVAMKGKQWIVVDSTLHKPQKQPLPGDGTTELLGAIVY
jgi:hypothetical protein